ncbi:MAG: DNA repair protein RecO [Lachnospiraceae bacterium]|nr:DNA repair protein RecO [Candidatus Hippenecus merdae]
MIQTETTVKGIVLGAFPQGEYGKRIVILSNTLGKITVFASGAAKQTSKIIGAVRPMTAAEFTLGEGRGAKSIHGVSVMDAFDEISMDPETAFYGMYFLELADYFGTEGMADEDAKQMLNLLFLALTALRKKELSPETIRRMFELRMLVHEGLYTEDSGTDDASAEALWRYTLASPLSGLFDAETVRPVLSSAEFSDAVKHLMNREVPVKFRAASLLS